MPPSSTAFRREQAMEDFSCVCRDEDGTAVITVTGVVDLATADCLWKQVSAQLDHSHRVLLDCAGVSFLDSMGLQVLVRAFREAAAAKRHFAVIRQSDAVSRVVKLSGLDSVLPVFDTADDARGHWDQSPTR